MIDKKNYHYINCGNGYAVNNNSNCPVYKAKLLRHKPQGLLQQPRYQVAQPLRKSLLNERNRYPEVKGTTGSASALSGSPSTPSVEAASAVRNPPGLSEPVPVT